MFNEHRQIAHMLHSKKKIQLFTHVSRFEMSDCPETSISGGAAIRPDVVLLQKVQPSVAACCCTPASQIYVPILLSADTHASVMVISREQQTNVGQ